MSRAALFMTLSLAAAAPAAAQDRQWIVQDYSPDGVAVMYGTPESDDVVLAFRCEPADGTLVVTVEHEPVRVGPDGTVGLILFSDAGEVALTARVERLEEIGVTLMEATTAPSPDLRAVLAGGDTLAVMIEDGAEEVPLAGSQAGFAALFAACRPQ